MYRLKSHKVLPCSVLLEAQSNSNKEKEAKDIQWQHNSLLDLYKSKSFKFRYRDATAGGCHIGGSVMSKARGCA